MARSMNNLKAERTLTAEELVTVRNEMLFVTIQDAYLRGLDWGRKYGSTEDEELKASYDYADKTTSALRSQSLSTQQPMGEPVAWMHPTAGWARTKYHSVLVHCRKDGPKPIPLYALLPNQESGE